MNDALRILFVSAYPGWVPKLDLDDEMQELRRSVKGRGIELILLPAARPEDLKIAIADKNISVVHFSGPATDEDGLLFCREDGTREAVSPETLAEILSGEGVKLAVLNTCGTRATANQIESRVHAVISTSATLDRRTAKKMTKVLYAALGRGATVNEAFNEASSAIEGAGLPNVYECAGAVDDTQLFAGGLSEEKDKPVQGWPEWNKYFYLGYLDDQIASATESIRKNRLWFRILLVLGLAATAVIVSFIYLKWNVSETQEVIAANWDTLIGSSLLDLLTKAGAAIPPLISLYQRRLVVSGNEELRSLQQMREMVKTSDQLPDELLDQLRKIVDQGLRGADKT